MRTIAASIAITVTLFTLAGLTSTTLGHSGYDQKDLFFVAADEDGTTSVFAPVSSLLKGKLEEITYCREIGRASCRERV